MADNSTELLPPALRGKLIGGQKGTGAVVGVLTAGALVAGGLYLAPIIIKAAENLMVAVIMAAGAAAVILTVTNKKFQSLIGLGFALVVRRLHTMIWEQQPYAVVRYIIAQMKEKIASGQARLSRLRGANNRIQTQIKRNQALIEERTAKAAAASTIGKQSLRDAQARMIGQVTKANDSLSTQLGMQLKLTDMLQAGLENAGLRVEEQEAAVELAITTNQALNEGSAAAADVVAAIQGDPARAEMFNGAMTVIANDTALQYGQIEQMMTDLAPTMQDIELGKIIDAQRGEKLLASVEKHVELIGAPSSTKDKTAPVTEAVVVPITSKQR